MFFDRGQRRPRKGRTRIAEEREYRLLFDQLLLAITLGLKGLFEKIPGGNKLFGGAMDGLGAFSQKLDGAIDADAKKFDALGKSIGGVWAGSVHSRAVSILKNSPLCLTSLPVKSLRMISIASNMRAIRSGASGQ